MLAGFETPTSGRILLNGQDLADLPPYERPINMMFQSYALFPHLTVWDNIAFGLRRDGWPRTRSPSASRRCSSWCSSSKFAKRKPHQLSGGQQQRVALARSLAKRPQLLLLDEPLGALDKKLREETQIELVNIIEEVGVTCVMVTHDQEEAMTMASRIAVMSEGRFLQVGAPSDIYETPATRFVADFIGNVNLMDGTLDGRRARPRDRRLRRLQPLRRAWHHRHRGHAGQVAVRPEKIHLLAHEARTGDSHNRVQGTIKDLSYFGSFTVYHLELASGAVLKVSQANARATADDELTWGDTAWAHWSRTVAGGADAMSVGIEPRCKPLSTRAWLERHDGCAWPLRGDRHPLCCGCSLFFMLPFLIVLKISVSEMETVQLQGPADVARRRCCS